jgi:hypothetical protein
MHAEGSWGRASAPRRRTHQHPSLILRILALALIDGITIWLVYQMVFDGYWPLAATFWR